MRRHIAVATMIMVLLAAFASPALADDDDDDDDDEDRGRGPFVELLTDSAPSVTKGDTVWLSFLWTATGADVEDFRVTVSRVRNGEIMYPTNTGDHTSLMQDATLSNGEIDFTAIRLSVPYDSDRTIVTLQAEWTFDGRRYSRFFSSGESARTARFRIPLDVYSGDDVSLVDLGVQALPAGSGGWLDLGFTGHAPVVSDFRVVLTDSSGMAVEYPQSTFTSLVHDALLDDGETDIARVYVDTSDVDPGPYRLGLQATWNKNGSSADLVGTVPVEVVGP